MTDKVSIFAFADEAANDIAGQIAAMRKNGLQGLEIRGVDGKNVMSLSNEKAKEIRSAMEENGLRVWSIGSPIGKIKITDPFAPHLDSFRRSLELADLLGASVIRLFSFYIPAGEDPAVYRDEVMERMTKMAEAGRDSGIVLCHENEKGIYGDNADRCLDLLTSVPGIKAVFDPANFVQCGEDTLRAWAMLAPYVYYMHIKDADKNGMVVLPGTGEGNVPAILSSYLKKGGRAMTLEPHLTVFTGLNALEREGDRSGIGVFSSREEAFDTAATELKKIVASLGYR